MKCEVTLYNSGHVFKEEVFARDYEQAREVAMARNPGSTHVSTTAVFDKPTFSVSEGSSSSSNSSVSSSSSSGGGIGLGGLLALGGLVGLISMCGGDSDEMPKIEQHNNSQVPQVEQIYAPTPPPAVPIETLTAIQPEQKEQKPFFMTTGTQEEPIDDLGQDWEK